MFGFLKRKSKGPQIRSISYMSDVAKIKALVELAKSDPDYRFLCWFTKTKAIIESQFQLAQLDGNRVLLAERSRQTTPGRNKFVMVEHHPSKAVEDELFQQLDVQVIDVYNSLQEPLFRTVGAEKMIALMQKMGMKEDEAIEHSLVSNSIKKLQEKFDSNMGSFINANSQEEWIRKNSNGNYTGM